MQNFNYKLYYDGSIITDQTLHNNKPHIVILDNTIKEAHLINVVTPIATTFIAPTLRSSRSIQT